MSEQEQDLPKNAYAMLLVAVTVAPALVTGALVLMIDGRVPDFSKGTEIAQFAIALVGGLTVWGVGIRAYMRRGRGAANRRVAAITGIQPILWFLGIAIGVSGALGIIDSAVSNRTDLAGWYCDDVMERTDARWADCMAVAIPCDDEADAGPCGEIKSPDAVKACMTAHDERRAALTDAQRAEVPKPDGDYDDAMRTMCIVERLANK